TGPHRQLPRPAILAESFADLPSGVSSLRHAGLCEEYHKVRRAIRWPPPVMCMTANGQFHGRGDDAFPGPRYGTIGIELRC
ncbi:MAG: hypothetical protein EB020_08580, partial [Proteobacteria bacterium]|nr:hypothetical protein [Pseudomonadota bacterium]